MRNLKFWIFCLAAPAFGFTDCTYFSSVNVPADDNFAPTVGTRVYPPGQSDVILFGDVRYETEDPEGQWYFAPFGYDSGGVRALQVTALSDRLCCQSWNPNICSWTIPLVQPVVDEVYAEPGDSVSNGRFLWFTFKPATYRGETCKLSRFGYTVQAVDFAGNTSTATGSIVYAEPEPPPINGGYTPPIVGGGGGGGSSDCNAGQEGNTCWTTPAGCQPGFLAQGTWQCVDNRDTCVLLPEGVPGSYCGGPSNGSTRLGCGRGMYQDGWAWGSACTIGGANGCMPGTRCISGIDPKVGAACGPVPACGDPPACWRVDEAAAVCSQDDVK